MRRHILRTLICVTVMAACAGHARACDSTIKISNWGSCRVGPLGENGGDSDWAAVPRWAKDPQIRPYFMDDPRLLANHGLCNEKFHRVVLCLPGWQESADIDACWYLICAGRAAANWASSPRQ